MSDLQIIIVAAGSGSRFGGPLPKQFCDFCGRPVLMHTIDAFRRECPDAEIQLVLSKEAFALWDELCAEHNYTSPNIVAGGATRWESVKNALDSTNSTGSMIMIHDGARPLITKQVIDNLLAKLPGHNGVVPVVPVTDSLRMITDDLGKSDPVDRSKLRAVQTPQLFYADLLNVAYRQPYRDTFTDDASVMEASGYEIAICDGSPTNIKITNPADIAIAEALVRNNLV